MISKPKIIRYIRNSVVAIFAVASFTHAGPVHAQDTAQPPQSAPASAVMKAVGTVKAISGDAVTLITDSGSETSILVQDSTHMLRTAPGQKDLKGATAMHLQDLQVGDRMLVRATATADGKSVLAVLTIVMTKADVTAKQQQDREDWQKRGVGGLVKAVDPATGTVTVSTSAIGANKTVAVHVGKATVIRRYAPDSVKFDDARPGTLDQIKPGDQLRARGDRNPDGTEITAQEIVSGAFQNIAGTVVAVDSASGTVKVMDLITKKALTLKISADSQMHQLPTGFAQRIAARLKGDSNAGNAGANAAGATPPAGGSPAASPPAPGAKADSAKAGPGDSPPGNGPRPGGGDFQQMLNHLPAVALADLKKGDAVIIVATEGSTTSQPTAITLLTGVDAILSASPSSGQAAMLLSPWNLGGGGGDSAGATP